MRTFSDRTRSQGQQLNECLCPKCVSYRLSSCFIQINVCYLFKKYLLFICFTVTFHSLLINYLIKTLYCIIIQIQIIQYSVQNEKHLVRLQVRFLEVVIAHRLTLPSPSGRPSDVSLHLALTMSLNITDVLSSSILCKIVMCNFIITHDYDNSLCVII